MHIRRTQNRTEHSSPKTLAEHTILRFYIGFPLTGNPDVPFICLADVSFIDGWLESIQYTKDLIIGLCTGKLEIRRVNL